MPSQKPKPSGAKKLSGTQHLRTVYERQPSCLRPIYTHGQVSASPSGSVLLPCSEGAKLLSWGEEEEDKGTLSSLSWALSGEEDAAVTVALSKSGDVGIVAGRSGFVDVLEFKPEDTTEDTSVPKLRKRFRPFERTVTALSTFDSSEGFVALASRDGHIRVYDVETSDCTHVFRASNSTITAIAFHPIPTRYLLYVGMEDGTIHAFNLSTRKRAPDVTEKPHVRAVTGFAFLQSGKIIVSSSRDNTICASKIKDLKRTRIIALKEPLSGVCTTIEEEGMRCVTVSEMGMMHMWDMGTGSQVPDSSMQLPVVRRATKENKDDEEDETEADEISVVNVGTCEVLQDGAFKFLVALSDQSLLVIKVRENGTPVLDNLMCGNLEEIYDIAPISSPHQELVVASNSSTVWVMRPPQRKSTDTDIASNISSTWSCSAGLQGHSGLVLAIDSITSTKALGGEKSLASAFVASASRDTTARVWRRSRASGAWECFAVAKGHTEAVGGVALSQQTGKGLFYLVTAAADRTLKLWSLDKALEKAEKHESNDDGNDASGGNTFGLSHETLDITNLRTKWTVLAHEKDINSVAVSPDGNYIATGSQDKTLKLWNASKGKLHATCRGHRRGLWDVCFSTRDKLVASSSGDNTVRIWSVQNGACMVTLEGHLSGVLKTAFISKGLQIASAGADGLLKVWNVASGECNATVDAHEDRIWALSAVEDGNKLLTGAGDGTISEWNDNTKEKADEEARRKDEEALMAQMVENDIRGAQWAKAAKGALELGMPQKLKKVIEKLIGDAKDADKELTTLVRELATDGQGEEEKNDCGEDCDEKKDDEDEKDDSGDGKRYKNLTQLWTYCRDWNATGGPASAALAARTLHAMFRVWTPDQLSDMLTTDKRALVEALVAHSTRHYARVRQLGTKVLFMEHVLNQMKKLPMQVQQEGIKDKGRGKKRKERDTSGAARRKKKGKPGAATDY